MKINTFVACHEDLLSCSGSELISEVLIEPEVSARLGRLSLEAAGLLAAEARMLQLHPVLVWDILSTQLEHEELTKKLALCDFSHYSACRVADLGAAYWMLHNTKLPLQLMCEAGSHNQEALYGWCEYFGDRLERLLVSHELPEPALAELCQHVPCALEVLGAGRIELFYSPRRLLSKNFTLTSSDDETGPRIEVTAVSADSHFKPFPVIETIHGTMMYLHRDRFMLDRWSRFCDMGIHTARVDLRHLSSSGYAADGIQQIAKDILDKKNVEWPTTTGAPFRNANNTFRSSERIRVRLDKVRSSDCIAQVIATEKNSYTVFRAVKAATLNEAMTINLATGDTMPCPRLAFYNVWQKPVTSCVGDQVFVTNWIRKAVVGSTLVAQ
jgi:U32 family peptidase